MIKAAALKLNNGKVVSGWCHGQILSDLGREEIPVAEGFITDEGVFVNRQKAAKIAFSCGQIKEEKYSLFSYDI